MNQLSYHVSSSKLKKSGLKLGNNDICIVYLAQPSFLIFYIPETYMDQPPIVRNVNGEKLEYKILGREVIFLLTQESYSEFEIYLEDNKDIEKKTDFSLYLAKESSFVPFIQSL